MRCEVAEFASVEELQAYVRSEKSGLHATLNPASLSVSVYYYPSDLIVHKMLEGTIRDISDIDSLRKIVSNFDYFVASFSKNSRDLLNPSELGASYSDILQTLSFRMHDHALLITSAQDTISLADFILDRTYGLSASTDLLLVFPRDSTKTYESVELVIREFGLKTGVLRFRFNRRKLDEVPRLDFEKSRSREFFFFHSSDTAILGFNLAYDQKSFTS